MLISCALKRQARTEAATELEGKPNKSLHQAAADGDIEKVKSLISKGADVNAKDESRRTALHYASEKGQKEVVELLTRKGVDINTKTDEDKTASALAKENGHTEIVRLLRKHGAKE